MVLRPSALKNQAVLVRLAFIGLLLLDLPELVRRLFFRTTDGRVAGMRTISALSLNVLRFIYDNTERRFGDLYLLIVFAVSAG